MFRPGDYTELAALIPDRDTLRQQRGRQGEGKKKKKKKKTNDMQKERTKEI